MRRRQKLLRALLTEKTPDRIDKEKGFNTSFPRYRRRSGRSLMTVILDVPCIYGFYGNIPGRQRPCHRKALHRFPVNLPVLKQLPDPCISVVDADDDEAMPTNYYMIDGILMRAVRRRDEPTTIGDIETATDLVCPPNWTSRWFEDHPSALFQTIKRPHQPAHYQVVPNLHEYRIISSDLDERLIETRDIWAHCVVYRDTVLAPVRPPTWLVQVDNGFAAIDVCFTRRTRHLAQFHFDIRDQQAALDFADRVAPGGDVNLLPIDCTVRDLSPQFRSGPLDTAQALAFELCKRHAGRSPTRMDRHGIRVFTSLRSLFEGLGGDDDAEVVLAEVAGRSWPDLPPRLKQWISNLNVRRELLDDYAVLADLDVRI